jgi:hypothetical protein
VEVEVQESGERIPECHGISVFRILHHTQSEIVSSPNFVLEVCGGVLGL